MGGLSKRRTSTKHREEVVALARDLVLVTRRGPSSVCGHLVPLSPFLLFLHHHRFRYQLQHFADVSVLLLYAASWLKLSLDQQQPRMPQFQLLNASPTSEDVFDTSHTATTKLLSLFTSTRKPSTTRSLQFSDLYISKGIARSELNPKYLSVPALRLQLSFQVTMSPSAERRMQGQPS